MVPVTDTGVGWGGWERMEFGGRDITEVDTGKENEWGARTGIKRKVAGRISHLWLAVFFLPLP